MAGLQITAEGLAVGASLGLRSMVIGVLSIGFVASTDGVALMTSLHQHARLGVRMTYAVLAGYRMLQEMPAEWQTIRSAHQVRAPLRSNGRPRSGVLSFGRSAFALLVVSLRKGERMAQSLESRGLGLGPRTTWRPVPLGRTRRVAGHRGAARRRTGLRRQRGPRFLGRPRFALHLTARPASPDLRPLR